MNSNTEIFPWSDHFDTGIETIDRQHRVLVGLLNKLALQMTRGSDELAIYAVFDELVDYTVHHLQTEEAIWQQYFGTDELLLKHVKSHQSFVTEVRRWRSMTGVLSDEEVVGKIVAFLTRWLAFHILEDDSRTARVVLALQSGQSLPAAKEAAVLRATAASNVVMQAVLKMYDNLSARTLAMLRAISQRERAEGKLRLASSIIESSADAIFITDTQGRLIDVNPAFCHDAGLAPEALIGRAIASVKPLMFDSDKGREAWAIACQIGRWTGELSNRKPSGELEAVWLSLSIVKDGVPGVERVVGMVSSISQLLERHQALEAAANNDVLTGLPNRRLLGDRMEQAMERSKRNSTMLAVCLLDLDGFKAVNDTWGHAAGDEVLKVVTQRMLLALRGADTVARLGGDEFVLLLGELDSTQELSQLLERLLGDIATPIDLDRGPVQIGASIGAALYPSDATHPDDLLKFADVAMYAAKAQGKQCWRLYSASPAP